jgi:hypothetical protein
MEDDRRVQAAVLARPTEQPSRVAGSLNPLGVREGRRRTDAECGKGEVV